MNWDRIEGNWKQFKGSVKQQWGKLAGIAKDECVANAKMHYGK